MGKTQAKADGRSGENQKALVVLVFGYLARYRGHGGPEDSQKLGCKSIIAYLKKAPMFSNVSPQL